MTDYCTFCHVTACLPGQSPGGSDIISVYDGVSGTVVTSSPPLECIVVKTSRMSFALNPLTAGAAYIRVFIFY